MAAQIEAEPAGMPSLRAPGVFTNYFGGARARPFGPAPSLADQVTLFIDTS